MRPTTSPLVVAQDPLTFDPLGPRPDRHLAGRAVGQRPVGPVLVLQGEPAPQLDRVDVEPVQHVLVDDRQLLDRIVDADRPWLEPQMLRGAARRRSPRCPTTDARRNRSAPDRFPGGSTRPVLALERSSFRSPFASPTRLVTMMCCEVNGFHSSTGPRVAN